MTYFNFIRHIKNCELVITDSVDSIKQSNKIEVLSCSKIFGETMYNVHHNKSIDELFIT